MPIDLKAYAGRIEHKGQLAPNLATLQALHLAHATHITFENLDLLMGKPIRLDLESLAAKLIQGGRGGYCFEQNALFAGALEEIGFRVTRLAARVRMGSQKITPRTHMLLAVDIAGECYLADVGFGDDGIAAAGTAQDRSAGRCSSVGPIASSPMVRPMCYSRAAAADSSICMPSRWKRRIRSTTK